MRYNYIGKTIVMKRIYYGIPKFDFRLLKRNFCAICGSRLKIKFREMVECREYRAFVCLYKVSEEIHYKTSVYHCSNCNYDITYSNQLKISRKQKEECSIMISGSRQMIKELKFKSNYKK